MVTTTAPPPVVSGSSGPDGTDITNAVVAGTFTTASIAPGATYDVTVVVKRMQGRDHPVLMTVPETYYLKCFILRKLA